VSEPPAEVRAVPPAVPGATRLVLVRHGEAVCNVEGIVGGMLGCRGLTDRGRGQVEALADRLARTGELAGTAALYASTLPRAMETAALLAPALERDAAVRPLVIEYRQDLRELIPGEGDGLGWDDFVARYGVPEWGRDPHRELSPGGESWSGFVARAGAALADLVERHPGQLVVVATHAGVVEASLRSFWPFGEASASARLGLRTDHASLTEWEFSADRAILCRYNDVTRPGALEPPQQA
jgi:probable phosphoglycerate mutase